jgi:UDP-galactopyranose mutase
MSTKKIVIIGAGFSGSTAAFFLSKKGYDVTVLESESHPGGGCWTRFHGEHPYTIGPRIFYSYNQKVYDHLNSFVKIRNFNTTTISYVEKDDCFYNYPLQYEDLPKMIDYKTIQLELKEAKKKGLDFTNFENYWISAVGETLYNKFVKEYSKKMWSIDSNQLLSADFKWINRGTPIRDGDLRLFGDQYQGYPYAITGYNDYFLKSLKGSKVYFNETVIGVDSKKCSVSTKNNVFDYDILINTGHTDEIFGYKHGILDFSGRKITRVVLPNKYVFDNPDHYWIHYSSKEEYTRVVDFKKVTNNVSNNCLLTIESMSDENRLYPKQIDSELSKYNLYKKEFPSNYFTIGRLGKFKYTGITDAIEQAMELSEEIK